MKQLTKIPVKYQYTFIQALYWMANCASCGYAAVYLLHRGLSNTMIGFVVGGAALLSMLVQPLTAQLAESIPFLSVKRMIQVLIVLMAGCFAVLTWVPLPVAGVFGVFLMMNMMSICMPPLMSAMGMEFINRGYYLNFGLSRGMGSISYAVCAAILGFLLNRFNPGILGYIFIGLEILLFCAVAIMEDLGKEEVTVKNQIVQDTEESMFKIVMKNPVFLSLMIGFCLTNMSSMAVCTYMVNIVKDLGGTDATLGIANFISAASEMPVMLLFGYFMKRSNCIKLLKVSALFFVLRMFVLWGAGSLPVACVGIAMQGLSFGLFTPAAVYYVNSTLTPEKRVKGQAVFSMITSGAATCGGNILAGWLQDAFGLKTMQLICMGMAFVGFLIIVRLPSSGDENVSLRYRIGRWLHHRSVGGRA